MAQVQSKKKKLRKEGKEDAIPEDEPARMELSIKVMISRMFAEFEQRKRQLEDRDQEQRKKQKEEQAERESLSESRTPKASWSTRPCLPLPAGPHAEQESATLPLAGRFMEALQKREQKMWEKTRQKRVQVAAAASHHRTDARGSAARAHRQG